MLLSHRLTATRVTCSNAFEQAPGTADNLYYDITAVSGGVGPPCQRHVAGRFERLLACGQPFGVRDLIRSR